MDSTPNKKQIKKLIIGKLNSGMSKQQVFEEMIPENKIGKDLAFLIQSVPSLQAKNKFKSIHVLFIVFLILIFIIMIMARDYGGIFWTVPVLYLIATVQPRYYGWALIPALHGLNPGLRLLLQPLPDKEIFCFILGIIILLISLLVAVLGFYLSKKLTPNFTESKEAYEDDEGNTRYSLVLRFKD